jgi:hypothetical protein
MLVSYIRHIMLRPLAYLVVYSFRVFIANCPHLKTSFMGSRRVVQKSFSTYEPP